MIVRIAAAVIAALGVLAGGRAWQLANLPPPSLPSKRIVELAGEAGSGPAVLTRVERSQIEQFVTRPPFAPDRRPAEAAAVTASAAGHAAPDTGPPAARLLGVITDGGARIAVLVAGPEQLTTIVRSGGEVEGWMVESIDDERVILRKDSDTVEILLFKAE